MPLLEDYIPGENFHALFVGEPTSGKTIGYAGFPKPMYVFSFDSKIGVILKHFRGMKGIEYDVYDTNKLDKAQKKLEEIIDNPRKYATVVVDPLTMFATSIVLYSLGLRKADTKRNDFKAIGHIDIPEWQEYQAEQQALTMLLSSLIKGKDEYGNWDGKSFPGNFIMCAHIIKTYDKVKTPNGIIEVEKQSLWTAGQKTRALVHGYFQEVWYIKPETTYSEDGAQKRYFAYTQPINNDLASTQLILPGAIDFTYPLDLYSEVQKHLKASKEAEPNGTL
jgi:hypothetical protein